MTAWQRFDEVVGRVSLGMTPGEQLAMKNESLAVTMWNRLSGTDVLMTVNQRTGLSPDKVMIV